MLRKATEDYNKQAKVNFHYYCGYCGHTISFYAFEPDRKLCHFCGRFNYRNDLAEFKDKLIKKKKEVEL